MLPRQVAVEVDPADSAGTQLMMLDLDEEHEACRLATSQLEECAIGFIDRIFRMVNCNASDNFAVVIFSFLYFFKIENLPEEYGSNAASQSTEGNLLGMALVKTHIDHGCSFFQSKFL